MTKQTQSRIVLVAIAVIFLGSFGVASVLRFSGWQPSGRTNYGELLAAPIDATQVTPVRANGDAYGWRKQPHTWRIVVFAPAACAAACVDLGAALEKVWRTEGRHADRLHVLWFGDIPDATPRFRNLFVMRESPQLRERVLQAGTLDGLPVHLVDPNGFVVLRYRSGFDASGLRRDLGRLIK
ncbi:MAG: hypothetical protein COW59_02475 [Lysobacterales bacterium CG17_big_fil_post_rev_8_21_14_2_50_64_11]|nr:MAG: hypothetical protein COW59_02475 [Xanthomonadales bacterium CG17_big_fil_post_rev_8_21_14_2_50_64_11]PIX61317.1 MAG: hypothetical protein COZ47_02610 [Xanthomonadales bacterium CG_4_10_14_3_um_filter_64_11]